MGYSSLARLRRVPAHILKIDKLFVENLVTSQGDRAILRAIYDLATAMGHAGRRRRGRDHGPARGADQDRLYQGAGLLLVPAVPADEVPAMVARLVVRQLLAPQPCHEDAQLASDVRLTSVQLTSVESQPASGRGQRRMLD